MEKDQKKKKKYRGLKIFFKILLGLLIFIFLLLLFIRSPWGQGIIIDKVISSIEEKTGATVEVEELFITFGGNITLKGLYIEDLQGDTLVYSKYLEADLPIIPIIRKNKISLDHLEWEGVVANVVREDSISGFNYQFLLDAYAAPDSTATPADTTAAGYTFNIGTVDLANFDLTFKDDVTGIDSQFNIEKLDVEMEETNLDSMRFHVNNADLRNTTVFYHQTKPFPETENEDPAPLPYIIVDKINLDNVSANYASIPDGLAAVLDVEEFRAESAELQLQENIIDINRLVLNNSEVAIKSTTVASTEETSKQPVADEGFTWPEWNVDIESIALQNNEFSFFADGAIVEEGKFNPQAIQMKDLDLIAENVLLKDQSAAIDLQEFSFSEASGMDLKQFNLSLKMDSNKLVVNDLDLLLEQNEVHGELVLQYDSIDDLINTPEDTQVQAQLSDINLLLQDFFPFQPDLKNNEYVLALSRKPLSGNLKIDGSLSSLEISSANFNWGNRTSLSAKGTVNNPMDPEKLTFNFPQFRLNSSRSDLQNFIKEEDLGIKIPEQVALSGSFSGNPEDITTDAVLKSSDGNIMLNGNFNSQTGLSFNADLEVEDLQLGQLLQNKALGPVSLDLKASGSGAGMNDLDATLEATVSSFTYNNYEIEDFTIQGELENGAGTITSAYKDENLNATLEAFVELDSVAPKVIAELDVIGADLQAFGLTSQNIKTAFNLKATFEGNAESYALDSEIVEGVFVYDNESFLLGDMYISAFVTPDTTALDVDNKMIDVELRSNSSPADFSRAIFRHYESYLTDEVSKDTVGYPVNLELVANINESPIIYDVFLPALREMDTVAINLNFNELEKELTAAIELPHINYSGYTIDSLSFYLDSNKEKFNFGLNFNEVIAGPINLKETNLDGRIVEKDLQMDFTSTYEDKTLVHVASEVSKEDGKFRVHLNPEDLIFNFQEWQIPASNEVFIKDYYAEFMDFRLTNGEQVVEFSEKMEEASKEHVGIRFNNFELSTFLSYFNPEDSLAKGQLNGNFIVEEPFLNNGVLADLQIRNFEVKNVDLGVLDLDASASGTQDYIFDLGLREGLVNMDLTGNYSAAETGAEINMELLLNELKMEALEGFTDGAITEGDGNISGRMTLNGTFAEPVYDGSFTFNNAGFRVATLDAPFVIDNENLVLNNDGIYFDSFRVNDESGNSFVINGQVLTESFINPAFDLRFEANNFQVLNSTEEDNELFYGTASFDATATLTGDLNLPVLDLQLEVGPETNVTYIIPEEELIIQERDGVVIFVNKENPDAILTRNAEDESVNIAGYDINAVISVNDGAILNIVLDEETGDNLQVQGEGDLNFNIYPNGRTTLTGRYEMSDGYYEMSLYGLVSRRFDIIEGSTITWAGDMFDATLDVKAVYEVETSATSLMAAQTSGADAGIQGRFRQEFPFLVYLNVEGELMQPTISFNLDMPESEQGAIGGQVYGRIQQLNNQEQELNKQVFSLLVLNRFFPEGTSDGSGGGTATIARDNLNEALSDQLNLFSEKLLGDTGVELDFGVDSFTDYQGASPTERTQLEISAQKSLLNDRLVVQVGSDVDIQGSSPVPGETTPLIGNVSIAYLLTEDGRYRLQFFRRNEFENVIDGQLIVSGIALIFTQEFNEFRELWDSLLRGQATMEEEAIKEETEEADEAQKEEEEKVNEEDQ